MRAQACAAPTSLRPQVLTHAHLGCGNGIESTRPCAGIGTGPCGGNRSRAGVIRVKQRESAPNSSACSWAVLREAPEDGGRSWLSDWKGGGCFRGQPPQPGSSLGEGATISAASQGQSKPRATPGPLWVVDRQRQEARVPSRAEALWRWGLSQACWGLGTPALLACCPKHPCKIPTWTVTAFLLGAVNPPPQ